MSAAGEEQQGSPQTPGAGTDPKRGACTSYGCDCQWYVGKAEEPGTCECGHKAYDHI